jgi:hypothetical protein
MLCNEFASVLEQQGHFPLPPAAQDHLVSCSTCQDFLADLSYIVAVARELPAEAEPPQRLWVNLRSQLEAEGLIQEPSFVTANASAGWFDNLRMLFRPRTLATAGVGLALVIAALLQLHKPNLPSNTSMPVAKQQVQPATQRPAPQQQVAPQIQAQAQTPAPPLSTKRSPAAAKSVESVLAPPPSMEVFQVEPAGTNLGETEVTDSRLAGNPALDESLRKNLHILNGFIAECEAHLKKHPHDTLAREYLNGAYQQKAQLIAAMLDSGRSEQ